MKKKQKQKYQIGEQVMYCSILYTINGVSWNGITYMYSFVGTDMRCGEQYLNRL